MPKLPKKLQVFAEALDLYNHQDLVKIDLLYPVAFKVFSKEFDYRKILKRGIPSFDKLEEYFGHFEIQNNQVFLPPYYFREWQNGELILNTINFNFTEKETKNKIVFLELKNKVEVLITFVFLNPMYEIHHRFSDSFDFLENAKNKEKEIREKLNLK